MPASDAAGALGANGAVGTDDAVGTGGAGDTYGRNAVGAVGAVGAHLMVRVLAEYCGVGKVSAVDTVGGPDLQSVNFDQ